MRMHFKKTLSTVLAVALLGCAAILSVSLAEGPYRHGGHNAFNGPPLGHPDKALIRTQWLSECDADRAPVAQATFDWGLECRDACSKCGFADSHVTPVVLDVPELLGPTDATAIDVIKRKLGINAFRGSIFEGPDASAAQLLTDDAPPELRGNACDALCPKTASCTPAACSTSSACAAKAACSAGNAQCDIACGGSGACTCIAEPRMTVGVATAVLPSPSRGLAFSTSVEADSVAVLRQASVDLDEAAVRLEISDRYAEADVLREAAQQLRVKARQLKAGAPAATASSTCAADVQATSYSPDQAQTICPESFIYPLYPATNAEATEPSYFQSPARVRRD